MAGVGLTVDVVRMGYEAARRRGSWLVCLLVLGRFPRTRAGRWGGREQFHPPMSPNGAQKYGDIGDSCSAVTALLICLRMVWKRTSGMASALERRA